MKKTDLFQWIAWGAATMPFGFFVVAGRCWECGRVGACVACCVLGGMLHIVFCWSLDKYADAKSEEGK